MAKRDGHGWEEHLGEATKLLEEHGEHHLIHLSRELFHKESLVRVCATANLDITNIVLLKKDIKLIFQNPTDSTTRVIELCCIDVMIVGH